MDRNKCLGLLGWLRVCRSPQGERGYVNLRVLDGSKSSSLSARRAWIEMFVNLRVLDGSKSLSARRAWIEIVDPDKDTLTDDGRSPQGERG